MTAVRPASIAVYAGLWTALSAAAALAPQLTGNTFDVLLPALLTITGQWLLLRDRTSWATRWAVAGIIGSLVPALAAIALHVFAPQARLALDPVYGCVVQIATAVPAVLVLLPLVGARAVALLLAPLAAWATRHYGLGPVAWPLLAATPQSPWLPALSAVPPAIRAVVEVAVLTWFISLTHRRLPASIEERPAADSATTASPMLGRLVPVWALVGVVLFIALDALAGGRRGYAPPPGQTLLIVLVLAPYVLALASTFVPMARPLGLGALAIGAGGVALIGAPIVASRAPWFLMGGLSAMPLLAIPALHGALAVSAFRAMWLTTAPARRSVAIVGGGVLILVYAIAVVRGFPVYRAQDATTRNAEARARPEARAASVHEALNRCFYGVVRASATPAWPRTVDDLGPNGLRCLTAEELRPTDQAYAIHVAAPAGDLPPAAFTVCVTRQGAGRIYARVVSERTDDGQEAHGLSTAAACANAMGGTLGRARYCLWDWAATHGGAYPDTLAALIGAGGCLEQYGSGESAGMRATYIPGGAAPDGRITTFVVLDGPTREYSAPVPRYRLDETGAVRSTQEPRLPIARDPLDRLWQRRPAELRRGGDQSGDIEWARGCDAGRLDHCIALGAVLEARAARWPTMVIRAAADAVPHPLAAVDGRTLAEIDLARAADIYASACRAGAAEGCAHRARLRLEEPASEHRDHDVWTLRAQACELGDGVSCDAQSAADAPGRPQGGAGNARAWTAACAGGSRADCTKAGRLEVARSGASEPALGLLLRGCDLGDAEACLEASHLLTVPGASLSAGPRRAEALRALACSMAPAPAGCAGPQPAAGER